MCVRERRVRNVIILFFSLDDFFQGEEKPTPPIDIQTCTHTFNCVWACVELVVECIYLILNRPSNSLIGLVPLLAKEGK